ncbi:unnamed protein product [Staurois parvus]|uniref:Uncharacterized protein n=1 Tax=Staurois parvus TaxID=386267 RepID=A0ABN9GWS3_9NEOB|nr:unnamed protein product [Staurois parvus]
MYDSGQYVQGQGRSVEGITVGSMYKQGGVQCTVGGYNSGQYVQGRSVEGMTLGSMYKRGVWRVLQWSVCTGEECGGMTVGSMYRRGVWRV